MIDKLIGRIGVPAIVAAVVWMFSTFATAADLERIESRAIRGEIRELCYKWWTAPPDAKDYVARLVMETVDELCDVNPDDRRCDLVSVDEVCHE